MNIKGGRNIHPEVEEIRRAPKSCHFIPWSDRVLERASVKWMCGVPGLEFCASIDVVNILLVSGSTRAASTNAAALASIAESAPPTVTTTLYGGLARLPAFNPDDDRDLLPDEVRTLRELIRDADAVLFCTPEYAGTLPGSFKNLLDWTVGGTEMTDKPVAWINVAAPGRGEGAVRTLEIVLGYVGARLVRAACLTVPVGRATVGEDGAIHHEEVSRALAQIWRLLG